MQHPKGPEAIENDLGVDDNETPPGMIAVRRHTRGVRFPAGAVRRNTACIIGIGNAP